MASTTFDFDAASADITMRAGRPATRLPWGAPHPALVRGILDDLERRLDAAGIEHSVCVRDVPTGWVPIAMVMTHHMCAWAAQGDEIVLSDIKEKYGTLRVHVYGGERVSDLADWCEEQSVDRCMVTGEAGRARNTGWIYTLSDKAHDLIQRDREALMRLMYPQHGYVPPLSVVRDDSA